MKFFYAHEYQPLCNELFAHYQEKLKVLLPDARVEHVGASSVPGAISKGDLDIFVGVDRHELEGAVTKLLSLNFKEKQDTYRSSELCMLETTSEDNVALQVVANNSEFEFFLMFRDRLCDNPSLIKKYNALKRSCEGLSHEEYRKRKSLFVEMVLSHSHPIVGDLV